MQIVVKKSDIVVLNWKLFHDNLKNLKGKLKFTEKTENIPCLQFGKKKLNTYIGYYFKRKNILVFAHTIVIKLVKHNSVFQNP